MSTDANGHVVPAAATSWENQNYQQWTFHLRPGAVWSDGSPVTAQDFVYSWQRLADPKIASPYASYLQYTKVENIDDILTGKKSPQTLGVKALDDQTLQVTLSEPVPYFISMLSHTSLKPVKRTVVEKFGDKWTLPANYVGNGAYRLKAWVVNERIVLERSPSYWNNKQTVINQATFLPITSEVSDVNRFRSGEIDITNSAIPPYLYVKMKREMPEQLHVNPYLCTFYYELNNKRAPFTDPRVRTAVKMTLDRDIIANKIMGQWANPGLQLHANLHGRRQLHSACVGRLESGATQRRSEETAGGSGLQRRQAAEVLAAVQHLRSKQTAGDRCRVDVEKESGRRGHAAQPEWKTSLESRHQGQYDVARATWCGDYNEPSAFLNLVLSNSSINTVFYKSPAFDAIMAATLKAPDEAARAALYQQAEAQLDKDSALVPVYYRVSARLIKPTVGGFTGKDPLDYTDVKNLYIIKQ